MTKHQQNKVRKGTTNRVKRKKRSRRRQKKQSDRGRERKKKGKKKKEKGKKKGKQPNKKFPSSTWHSSGDSPIIAQYFLSFVRIFQLCKQVNKVRLGEKHAQRVHRKARNATRKVQKSSLIKRIRRKASALHSRKHSLRGIGRLGRLTRRGFGGRRTLHSKAVKYDSNYFFGEKKNGKKREKSEKNHDEGIVPLLRITRTHQHNNNTWEAS